MKKEILLAIILGAVVALVVFGIYYRSQQVNTTTNGEGTVVGIESGNEVVEKKLQITHPVDTLVYPEKEMTITGLAAPEALVAVFVNDKEDLVTADAAGKFSVETILESGSNIISVYSVDENNEQLTDRITVIYSNKSLEETLVSDSEVQDAVEEDKKSE